jgi:predicted nucleic acid-binding protein
MIIIDTNVLSELLRPTPAAHVESWLSAQDGGMIYFTSVGEAELRYGLAILRTGKRKSTLARLIEEIFEEDFRDRILTFNRAAAHAYAAIAAERRAAGRPISQFDCQIAAIARANQFAVATRNVRDFEGCGISVIDPWAELYAKP